MNYVAGRAGGTGSGTAVWRRNGFTGERDERVCHVCGAAMRTLGRALVCPHGHARRDMLTTQDGRRYMGIAPLGVYGL